VIIVQQRPIADGLLEGTVCRRCSDHEKLPVVRLAQARLAGDPNQRSWVRTTHPYRSGAASSSRSPAGSAPSTLWPRSHSKTPAQGEPGG